MYGIARYATAAPRQSAVVCFCSAASGPVCAASKPVDGGPQTSIGDRRDAPVTYRHYVDHQVGMRRSPSARSPAFSTDSTGIQGKVVTAQQQRSLLCAFIIIQTGLFPPKTPWCKSSAWTCRRKCRLQRGAGKSAGLT